MVNLIPPSDAIVQLKFRMLISGRNHHQVHVVNYSEAQEMIDNLGYYGWDLVEYKYLSLGTPEEVTVTCEGTANYCGPENNKCNH